MRYLLLTAALTLSVGCCTHGSLEAENEALRKSAKNAQLVASRIMLDNGQLSQQLADANSLIASLVSERDAFKEAFESQKRGE